MVRYLQNFLIYIFLYIPPLIFFIRCCIKRRVNKLLLFGVGILYLTLAMFSQNFLPFILVLMNIRFIKSEDNGIITDGYENYFNSSKDYIRYNFNIKNFKFLNGIAYGALTYSSTIVANIIIVMVLQAYNINLNEQEIVRELSKGSLNQLLYMFPMMVLFAPIVEEFTFRWLLFEKILRPRIGIYMAAFISSIMFSLIHFNLRSFPVIMLIGIINCYFIDKKGYWYAVFNHLVFNSVTAVIMLLQKIS